MQIGHPSRVAIEYEIDSILPSEGVVWIYGRFRLWLAGAPVGDWMQEATLTELAALLDHIRANHARRVIAGVEGLTAVELFEQIDRALYQDDERTDDELQQDTILYAGTSVIPDADVLQAWRGYLVRMGTMERLVWRNVQEPGAPVCSLELGAGELDHVFEEFSIRIQKAQSVA